ncbi:hypothetical protein ACIQGZ_05710 [Streptomyces sp. NPDC092296]|uniref:hypothetical protein n=1 Tax=Streptomyces sp. NPDC092296 TaxID=3366012 RepID=UPI0037FE3DB9
MSSRESDNASPSPRRTGGDAYPSGTPPYGIPQASAAFGPDGYGPEGFGPDGLPDGYGPDGFGPEGSPGEPEADEGPKTETTLTTRIRINIPGSRPIPPVVVRSPVADAGKDDRAAAEKAPGDGPSRRRAVSPGSPVLGVMDAENRVSTPPNLPPEWQTAESGGAPRGPGGPGEPNAGEWFRPRKKSGGTAPAAAPVPAPAGPAPEENFTPPPAAGHPAFDEPAPGGRSGAGLPRRSPGPGSIPRPGGPQGPRPTGAPATPFAPPTPAGAHGHGEDDAFPGAAQPPAPGPFPPGLGVRSRPAPGGQEPQPPQGPYGGAPLPQPGAAAVAPGPDGFQPDGFQPDGFQPDGFQPDYGTDPFGTQPAGAAHDAALGETVVGGFPPVPDAGPGESTAAFPAVAFGDGRPAPGPRPGQPGRDGNAPAPFAPNPFEDGFRDEDFRPGPAAAPQPTQQQTPPKQPQQPQQAKQPEQDQDDAPRRRGRGRKLLVYAVAAVVCVAGVAYGAGLMLNQADVPKGTTVLGTDIGGSSRDAAVHTLDATVAKIGAQPVQLQLAGKAVALDPTAAGLGFDTTATVDGLTHHSYNPKDVIGSLTGSTKAVPPQVKIDPAKLRAALEQLTAQSGQGAREGYVSFTATGKATTVLPRVGQTVDLDSAVRAVEQGYRARALGEKTPPIVLKVTESQPEVSAADVKAAATGRVAQSVAANEFVYVKRGPADLSPVPFGLPSFSKALRLAPDKDGKVVPTFDLAALQARYKDAFSGYQLKHGSTVGPVTAQDVADAIISGLDKTGAARTVTLPVVTTG